jgi:3-hydroxyisobutyrate dehydrogenase
MKVGFIGLGSQGKPIAERMAEHGAFTTAVWARRPEASASSAGGRARVATSLADLGRDLDVLSTCVFDAQGTREILFAADGIASVMPRGGVIICHSTVAPQEIAEISAEAAEFGLRVLDAPVSGGAPKAAAGELVVMVGGDQSTYEEVLPILETFSNQIVHLGPVGAGQQAKLLNNTMLAAHIAIADDTFKVAARLGLDQGALGQILRNGSGRSFGVEIYLGSGSLAPMVDSQIRPTLTKDVGLVSQVVAGLDVGSVLVNPARTFVEALDALDAASHRAPAT